MKFDPRKALNSFNAGMYADASRSTSGTRWGRGLAVIVPSTLAVAALSYTLQSGAMAASFNVADQPLDVVIESADADGVAAVLTSINAKGADGSTRPQGVLHLAISKAKLTNVCIIAKQRLAGANYSIVIKAAVTGRGSGQNLIFDVTDATGMNAILDNVVLGRSADEISLNGKSLGGQPGGIGLDGPNAAVHLERLVATAWSAELLGAIKASDFTATIKPGVVTSC